MSAPWLPDPALAPPPPSWLDRAWARLDEEGALVVVGPASLGRRAALAALSRRLPGLAACARIPGREEPEEIIRALGEALGLPVRGDLSAIGAALSAVPDAVVLLDEAPPRPTLSALEGLRALAPGARFLLGAEEELPDLAHASAPRAAFEEPELEGLTDLPAALRDLAHLPWGLPGATLPGLPANLRLDTDGGLTLLPEVLPHVVRTTPADAARRLAPFAGGLMALAEGQSPPRWDQEADVLLLRFLARHHPDLSLATRAAAAASRLIAAAGQAGAARDLLDRAAARAPEREAPLLTWAEGDILLSVGLLEQATHRHQEAADAFRRHDDALRLSALLLGTASQLHVLGFLEESRRRAREAQHVALRAGERAASVGPLRLLAELAVSNGELVSADTLHDHAEAEAERAGVDGQPLGLSRASLAISRGSLSDARALLDDLDASGPAPALDVNARRRRCDLLLRDGRHDEVLEQVDDVIDGLRRLGQRAAAASAMRLRADALCVAGRPLEAAEAYRRALYEAGRAGDLHGARRSLAHLLALERSGRGQGRVEELLALLSELDTELSDPERHDAVRLEDALGEPQETAAAPKEVSPS